jgi:hypothetical protein
MRTPILHEVTLEHDTDTEAGILDVAATVWFDEDVWVVDFATPVPAADEGHLKASCIAKVEREIAKHNREFIIDQGLQARDYAAF